MGWERELVGWGIWGWFVVSKRYGDLLGGQKSHDVTSRYARSCNIMRHYVMSHNVTQCHAMSQNVMQCRAISRNVAQSRAMSRTVVTCCQAMSHDVV
jgi:hypothetical protein